MDHKEYRFVFLAVLAFAFLAAFGTVRLHRYLARDWSPWGAAALAVAFWAGFFVQITLNDRGWKAYQGAFRAFRQLSTDAGTCGVGLLRLSWSETGGYYYLHREVPLVAVDNLTGLTDRQLPLNRLVVRFRESPDSPAPRFPQQLPGAFFRWECWGHICLYATDRPCAPAEQIRYER